jgi:hypothetical protein
MHLTYRGQSYEAYTTPIEAVLTEETTITFLGQKSIKKQYQVEQPPQAPQELIFLGQTYVRGKSGQTQFCQPRPGERVMNSRQALQLLRSRAVSQRHPAFRGS